MKKTKIYSIFPSSIVIIISTFILYYWNILFYGETKERILFLIAMIMLIVGRIIYEIFPKYKRKVVLKNEKYPKLISYGLLMALIGVVAHLYFYSSIDVNNYIDNYMASRGRGYITVFFDFLPLGLLMVIQGAKHLNKKKLIFFIIICMFLYVGFYLLILMKRKQVLLLFIGVVVIFWDKARLKSLYKYYISGGILYIFFAIFAFSRNYLQRSNVLDTLIFVKNNFSFNWISPEHFEGKYASMILQDTIRYVDNYRVNPGIILAVFTSIIPRRLLGFKLLAFPEWYSSTFYPTQYSQGAGFAGSLIAEGYLIFSWLGVVILFLTIGLLTKKIDYLMKSNKKVLFTVVLYIILFLPRYDLASIFISSIFMFLPTFFIYRLCDIR